MREKKEQTFNEKRLISIAEAAGYLSRSPWTIAEMVRAGKLPYIRDGKRKLLDLRDLDSWIDSNKYIEHDSRPLSFLNHALDNH